MSEGDYGEMQPVADELLRRMKAQIDGQLPDKTEPEFDRLKAQKDAIVARQNTGREPPAHEDRYYALRDAVTMYAGDGVISDDAVINEASEHAKIAQCCICAVSDHRTERGAPQLRTVPLLSLQRLEWVYPYGSEEPYVRLSDLDKISRPVALREPPEGKQT